MVDEVSLSDTSGVDSRSKTSRILWWLVFGVLLFIHLAKNFTDIDHATFWQDESKNYYAATNPFSELTYIAVHQDQPPLHYYFLHEALRFGSSERYLRGTSWAFILLMIVFAAFGMKEDPSWMRLCFIFTFLFYYFSRYLSQEMRPYAMGILLTFIGSVYFVQVCGDPSRRNLLKYGIWQFLGMYTISLGLSSFLAQGVFLAFWLAWNARSKGLVEVLTSYRGIIVVMGIISVLYLPYVIWVAIDQAEHDPISKVEMVQEAFVLSHYVKGFQWLVQQDEWYNVPGYLLLVKHGALVMLLVGVVTELRRGNLRVLYWFFFIFVNIIFVRVLLYERHFYSPRYMVPCYFASCYLIALGVYNSATWMCGRLATQFRWPKKNIQLALTSLFLVGATGFAVPPAKRFAHYVSTPVPDRPWRALRKEMKALSGQKIVMFDMGRLGSMYQHVARHDEDIVFAPEYWGPDDLSDPVAILNAGVYERFPEATHFFYIQSHMTKDDQLSNLFVQKMEAYGFELIENFNNNLNEFRLTAYRVEN